MDVQSPPLWCMAAATCITCVWKHSKSLPFVVAMLAPAVFELRGTYTGAQFMASGAYIFFFLSYEIEWPGPSAPPAPPVVVQQQKLTPNPAAPIEIEDV